MSESNDFHYEATIAAPAETVFAALTTGEGLRSWWAVDADDAAKVDAVTRVGLGAAGWTDLRVDDLVPGRGLEWICVAQDIANFDPRDEWLGTAMRFDLIPTGEGGTRLEFVHRGLGTLGCSELCSRGWSRHLGKLKRVAEQRAAAAAGA